MMVPELTATISSGATGQLNSAIWTLAVSILSLVVVLVVAYKRQNLTAILKLYDIIATHHSQTTTELRRTLRDDLVAKLEHAKQMGQTLKELDSDLHLKVSTAINYYDGLGMFLRESWKYLPRSTRNTMLQMLHQSVADNWPTVQKFKTTIYGRPPHPDWGKNFEWLYRQALAYREGKNYTSGIPTN